MKAQQHPEYSIEQAYLAKTIEVLGEHLRWLDRDHDTGGNTHARESTNRRLAEKAARLRQQLPKPYFGRIDFDADDGYERSTFYIGREPFEHQGHQVIEWQAPLGKLYFQFNQPGRAKYAADGETYSGKLTLKRTFELAGSQVDTIHDTFDARQSVRGIQPKIIDPDKYLAEVLAKRADSQLHDIVATIQKEQDDLIRADWSKALVVQGAAGSGKTSIALYRLAYLLYPGTNANMDPERCIVFGPNPLFLKYISTVLPTLGVQGIRQTTVRDWAVEQLGLADKSITDVGLDTLLSAAPGDEKKIRLEQCRVKTSLRMGAVLKRYLEHRRAVEFPATGINLTTTSGQLLVTVNLSREKLTTFYEAYKNRPWKIHREQFLQASNAEIDREYENAVRQAVRELSRPVLERLANAHSKIDQAEQLEAWSEQVRQVPDGPLAEKNVPDLLAQGAVGLRELGGYERGQGESEQLSIDRQSEEALKQNAPALRRELRTRFRQEFDRLWKPLKISDDYFGLLTNRPLLDKLADGLLKPAEVAALYQTTPSKDSIDASDLPALLYLYTASDDSPSSFQHVIVDEAQDISPLEYLSLKMQTRSGSMTLLGDLAQAIYPHRGLGSWDELTQVLGAQSMSLHELTKSYRSTYEIMTFAKRILQSVLKRDRPFGLPDPLRRKGAPVVAKRIRGETDRGNALVRVIAQAKENFKNIAVICKTQAHSERIGEELKRAGFNQFVIAKSGEAKYDGGVIITPVHLAKGMEFEVGIIIDADRTTYSDAEMDGLLLYVAATRALHSLYVLWIGTMSPHLVKAVNT